MKILVINCGSSSLKYQLIDSETEELMAKGLCERIALDGRISYQPTGGEKETADIPMPTHEEAIQLVLDKLVNPATGVLKSLDEVDAIGHRVLHGGHKITSSALVTEEVLQIIDEAKDLGPLHNPANLIGIKACMKLMPGKPNVTVYDTSFGMSMPPKAYMYAVPYEWYENYHVRRYGFHGTSHSFVSKELVKFLGLDPENHKVIVCHLGNGSSISATVNGKCVDTSMGLTPLEGLIMGTRSGDIDPAILEYIARKEGKDVFELLNILNKKSGVYGMTSGLSSDFRDLGEAAANGNEQAKTALEAFSYRVAKYIGSYAVAMNGLDAIAFTGGIGENSSSDRKAIMSYLGVLGVTLDEEANKTRGENKIISGADSKVKVAIIPTNEELAIARETVALTK